LQHAPELLSLRARLLHDVGTLALLALLLTPIYLLLNQYWRSLVALLAVYSLLAFVFIRLARYIRRVMRRTPAEIPPWHTVFQHTSAPPQLSPPFMAAEAIQYAVKDPDYVQDVLKPRLRQLLIYRLSSAPDLPLDAVNAILRHNRIDPRVITFLQSYEATGLWARYRYRRQRLQYVLATLQQIESL
jgi:hypothetical protein